MTVIKTISHHLRIVRAYTSGATLRQIAKAEGVSHEAVRQHLIAEGVTLRPRRHFPGGQLGTEILTDLQEFPQGASVPELMEWLGEDRKAVLRTVCSLLKHGYVAVVPRSDP